MTVNASLARRLLLFITLGVGIAILVTILMQYSTLNRTMEGLRDQNVDASLGNMLPIIQKSMWAFDDSGVIRAANALLRDPYISGVAVHSAEGEINLNLGDLKEQSFTDRAPNEERTEWNDADGLYISTPVVHAFNEGESTIGWIYLRSDDDLIDKQVRLVLGGVIVSAVLTIVLLLVGLYALVDRMVAIPIKAFTDFVEHTSTGDVSTWVVQRDPSLEARTDEIGQLYQSFNDQRDRLIEHEQELLEYRTELEATVSERTEALQRSNTDLSESLEKLKIAQDELLQSEKLASLGNLVSGVAHEVNTPLGVSITAASHLTSEARQTQRELEQETLTKSDLERFFHECLETGALLSSNLDRAAQLIRSFKQVAVDQTSDEQRDINLQIYVDEILASLKPKYKNTQVTVTNNIDPDILLQLTPGALAQIITNLIINSLLHGFDDSTRTGEIRLYNRVQENTLELIYEDDGEGMGPDTQKRMFDPFFTTRRSSGGSGLGMNIVFNLVTGKLNGKIRLDSPPYQGCRLIISIPFSPIDTAPASSSQPDTAS
ncbi:sensor histidine kinase [Saccharospirillum impatiens]|uniref:sensor histidine kinase n=1 Tax=Saccharospirillum impatiens TaxID=169438 RepID=UPI0004246022|nr:HAMP domain-containing sensor histidine kinase [Saccharospirillum impatiens]